MNDYHSCIKRPISGPTTTKGPCWRIFSLLLSTKAESRVGFIPLIPTLQRQMQEDLCELEDSLVYISSSRPARETLSQNKQTKKQPQQQLEVKNNFFRLKRCTFVRWKPWGAHIKRPVECKHFSLQEYKPHLKHWVSSRAFPRNSWEEESPGLRILNSRGSNSNQKQAVHIAGSVVSTAR